MNKGIHRNDSHLNDPFHLLLVQLPIPVFVVHLKRPSESILKIASKNQVQCCYVLQEIERIVLQKENIYIF